MTEYITYIQDVTMRSNKMRQALIEPFSGEDGTLMLPNRAATEQTLKNSIKGSIFERTGDSALMIAGICVHALQDYEKRYKRMPSPHLLASAHKAMENVLDLSEGGAAPGIFNGIKMNSTADIQMRDRVISLILPVYLAMVTSNMATYILGGIHQAKFFRITQQAGSNFGGLKKGDIIDGSNRGLYAQMTHRAALGTSDGSTTSFIFDTKYTYSVEYPLKPKCTIVYMDRNKIGEENGEGVLFGASTVNGVFYSVNGTVTYAEGKISVCIMPAPPANAELEIAFDVDIEKAPALLPKIVYDTHSRVLYPHYTAIKDTTIQNIWSLCCDPSQNLDSLTMQLLHTNIVADKDHKHLYDMYHFCPEEGVICKSKSKHTLLTESYEIIKALSEVDNKLMVATGVAGLSGIIAGPQACNLFRYLPSNNLENAPDYRFTSQPHFVGKLFGSIDLYCDPHAPDACSCLCYAKGEGYGQAAYITGSAIPSLALNHSITEGLEKRTIMGELAYHDMQPFDGTQYLCKLTFATSE